jgi:hypothetical protein
VKDLRDAALIHAWSYADLPWDRTVDPLRAGAPLGSFLAGILPSLQRMSAAEQHVYNFREACFHLSSLLAGERAGQQLLAQVVVTEVLDDLGRSGRPAAASAAADGEGAGDRELLVLMAAEEAKHYLTLHRYLAEKAGCLYPADSRLTRVLRGLEAHPSPELKVLVGQVVLEWTAASLLATLVSRSNEPLLRAILRLNLRDEARHLAYSYLLAGRLASRRTLRRPSAAMQDIVFESIVGSMTALMAVPVWRELGLPVSTTRRLAVQRLRELGVIDRYARTIPLQLQRCGFATAQLERRLARDLEPTLTEWAEA